MTRMDLYDLWKQKRYDVDLVDCLGLDTDMAAAENPAEH